MAVVMLTIVLFGTGGCGARPPDRQFHADALPIDARYVQEIHFTALGVRVPLRRDAYVRVDEPVADTREHLRTLIRELGLTTREFSLTNPATNGMQLHLRFRDGKQCSFIWAWRDPDSRLTKSSVEHEKYHAVCRLAPEAIRILSARLSDLGFRLSLSQHDEELAATLVGLLTLHLEGVALQDIHGSDLVEKAVQLIRDSQAEPNRVQTTVPAYDSRVSVQWPQGKEVIEIPLEFLDDIPVVRCQLNGKAAILYLDTACQPICLYADRLARFGVKAGGQVDYPRYTALGHTEKTSLTSGFLLTFNGGLRLEVSGGPCLPNGARDPNHDVDGILGVKVMNALNGVIDLGARKMTFTVKAAPKNGPANGSPPIGSETNRTSSPAGPHR